MFITSPVGRLSTLKGSDLLSPGFFANIGSLHWGQYTKLINPEGIKRL